MLTIELWDFGDIQLGKLRWIYIIILSNNRKYRNKFKLNLKHVSKERKAHFDKLKGGYQGPLVHTTPFTVEIIVQIMTACREREMSCFMQDNKLIINRG